MNALHLLAGPPDADILERCRTACADGDRILLLEDGVYLGLAPGTSLAEGVPACAGWYALRDHVQARGLDTRLQAGIELVDYDGFVRLVAEHQPVVSWYR